MSESDHEAVKAKLLQEITDSTIDDESFLDEMVHDLKSGEAADINNGGYDSQIEYLLKCGVSEADLRKAIHEANAEA